MLATTQPSPLHLSAARCGVVEPEARDYAVGSMIAAKYRLERVLGAGGMGTVWLARNVVLDLPVALKVILPAIRAAPDMVDRLLAEARVEARLRHDNIVRVFDFGEAEPGSPFIVMELLEGQTVSAMLDQRGKLDAVAAVQLLLPVVQALDHAHQVGVVHQDIKPDNIFLARNGHALVPKILDFGIAKWMSTDVSLEPEGTAYAVGSPAYMAPEQALGLRDVDQRADVFAISEVLYECVVGRPAFECHTRDSLAPPGFDRDARPPPASDARTASLWAVLEHGLAIDRTVRVASMAELGASLASWLKAQGVHDDALGIPLTRSFCLDAGFTGVPNWHIAPPPTAAAASRARWRHALVHVVFALALALFGAGDRGSPRPDGPTLRGSPAQQ